MLLPLAPMTPHRPVRPMWACQCCTLAWPCPQAKQDLVAEFEGRLTYVVYYMSAQLIRYEADLAERDELPDPKAGYRRFINWARSLVAAAKVA